MTRQSLFLIPLMIATGCTKPTISTNGDISAAPVVVAAEPVKIEKAKEEPAKKEVVAEPVAGTVFHFAEDEGGKILAKILPPQTPKLEAGKTEILTPIERHLPSYIEHPDVPTATNSTVVPRVPQPTMIAPRPVPLIDRVPFDLASTFPELPDRIVFPAGALTKLETLDVKQPAPLPILAQPTPDRASLEDPTLEFTSRSILNERLPLRSTEAPFVKVNLPDPFENVEAAKVKLTVKEDPLTAVGNRPPPKP